MSDRMVSCVRLFAFRKDISMNNKDRKRQIAYEVLMILGSLALLTFICRLWPILLLIILGIFVAAIRLLFLSGNRVDPVEPQPLLPAPIPAPTESDLRKLAHSLITSRITTLVLNEYPNARWIWEAPNAFELIELGEEVYILVTVYMPTVEEDPHENAAVRQSIELLQAQKDELAKNLMAEITLCSLMGRTTNFARQLVSAVEEVMTPYSTEPPEEYMEFADMTEELKADYAKSVDCLKLPNGKIVECGSYPYFSKYSIVDGKVSQNKVGPLHHTRRTKQSRKIQYLPNCPRQKVYKTFEKYAEDYRGYEYNKEEKRYGFYCNPNAMWDWYQIGGRWPVTFLVKADCTEYSFGERSWGNYSKKYPAPEGYMWVSAARKKDICWDIMRSWYIAQDTERYTKLKEAFQCGKLPDEFHGEFRENGFFCCGKCAYAAGETLDEYLARIGIPKSWKYPIGVSDIVDADEWLSKNDISIGKESSNWHEQIDTYIDDLDGEDVLVSVDYHM